MADIKSTKIANHIAHPYENGAIVMIRSVAAVGIAVGAYAVADEMEQDGKDSPEETCHFIGCTQMTDPIAPISS